MFINNKYYYHSIFYTRTSTLEKLLKKLWKLYFVVKNRNFATPVYIFILIHNFKKKKIKNYLVKIVAMQNGSPLITRSRCFVEKYFCAAAYNICYVGRVLMPKTYIIHVGSYYDSTSLFFYSVILNLPIHTCVPFLQAVVVYSI